MVKHTTCSKVFYASKNYGFPNKYIYLSLSPAERKSRVSGLPADIKKSITNLRRQEERWDQYIKKQSRLYPVKSGPLPLIDNGPEKRIIKTPSLLETLDLSEDHQSSSENSETSQNRSARSHMLEAHSPVLHSDDLVILNVLLGNSSRNSYKNLKNLIRKGILPEKRCSIWKILLRVERQKRTELTPVSRVSLPFKYSSGFRSISNLSLSEPKYSSVQYSFANVPSRLEPTGKEPNQHGRKSRSQKLLAEEAEPKKRSDVKSLSFGLEQKKGLYNPFLGIKRGSAPLSISLHSLELEQRPSKESAQLEAKSALDNPRNARSPDNKKDSGNKQLILSKEPTVSEEGAADNLSANSLPRTENEKLSSHKSKKTFRFPKFLFWKAKKEKGSASTKSPAKHSTFNSFFPSRKGPARRSEASAAADLPLVDIERNIAIEESESSSDDFMKPSEKRESFLEREEELKEKTKEEISKIMCEQVDETENTDALLEKLKLEDAVGENYATLDCSEIKRPGEKEGKADPVEEKMLSFKKNLLFSIKGLLDTEISDTEIVFLSRCIKEAPLRAMVEIVKDVPRTFPRHPFFWPGGKGQEELLFVLTLFLGSRPELGYCQSMNLVVGILLLVLDKVSAFWAFQSIVENIFPVNYFMNLQESLLDARVILELLKSKSRKTFDKIRATECEDKIVSVIGPWFLSMFVIVLPINILLKVWDSFFLEGFITFYKCAFSLIYGVRHSIQEMAGEEGILELVLKAGTKITSEEDFFYGMYKKLNGLSKKKVKKIKERLNK